MELKKSPKADLENKKVLFLEIGLIISLALMITAFSVSQKEKTIEKFDLQVAPVEEEIVEITRHEDKPLEQPKTTPNVISDIIDIVKDDAKITQDFSFAEFDEDVMIVKPVETKEEAVEADEPIWFAEEMPTFQGGDKEKFRNWVQGKLDYPLIARENNIQGTVNVKFFIDKDGNLTGIEILSSPDKSLSEETIRVLKTSPKWAPGKQRNKPVPVNFSIPIIFKLQ